MLVRVPRDGGLALGGGAAPRHRCAQRAPRSAAGSCANRPVAHRVDAGHGRSAEQEVAMRRVFRWLIPLALIAFGLLWPLVFRGGSEAVRRSTTPWSSAITTPTSSSTADGELDAVETHHRRVPQRPARHLPVLGRRQPEQPPAAADSPRSPRSCSTASRCPTRCCGRTASGSGSPRSAIPDRYLDRRHPRLRDPLHHPRRPRPRQHRRRQAVRRIHRRSRTSTSAFFWNVIAPGLEQHDRTRRHLGHPARRRHRRAVLGRLRRRPGLPAI